MKNNKSIKTYLQNHWLLLLIVLQPVLDIIAFWSRSPDGTVAGTIRLIIMLAMPLYLLIVLKDKKPFFLSMLCIAAVFILHFINCLHVGYVDLAFDLAYAAKTAQMPILAICFSCTIKNEQTRNQAYWGLFFAAAITAASLFLGIVTGTANITYGEGLGISGWVIDDLRCANSVIVVVLAAFAVFCSVKSDKKAVQLLVPAVSALVLIINGTKACYFSIFLIFVGFSVFLIVEKFVKNQEFCERTVVILLLLSIVSACVYPLTPVYKVAKAQQEAADKSQSGIDALLEDLRADIAGKSAEELLADPEIHSAFERFYHNMISYRNQNIFNRFGYDKVFLKYNMSLDAAELDDVRILKRNYASLLWDESDLPTKFFGLDVSDLWCTGKVDLENDWPAIYYYYGYVGIAAYVLFILYFVYLILRRVLQDFRSAFTTDNFILLITLVLLIGLAQYSGSVLRRPNVSFYLSVVLGLIYYQTAVKPVGKENSLWGKRR